MAEDVAKIIGAEIFLIVVGGAGIFAYVSEKNYWGLSMGIACCVVFALFNIVLIVASIGVWYEERKNKNEKN